MRFGDGYFRTWGDDLERFFFRAPQDYCMFCFLLASAHRKDDPYQTIIKGKIYKVKEPYCQKWSIQKGDYFGSKEQIREFWGFDNRTQIKIFKSLGEKGLADVLLSDPALIVRIKNYPHFAWRGKNGERPPFVENNPHVESHTPHVIMQDGSRNCASVFVGVEQNYIQSNLQSSISSLKKGEGEAPSAETHPPFKSKLEEGNGIGIGEGEPIEDRKVLPPALPVLKTIGRQDVQPESPLKPMLGSKRVWEIFTAERLKICGIEKTSPTSGEINQAQILINELKTEEVILERIQQFLNWKKEIYVNRAWPIRMLVEDRLEIGNRKEVVKKKLSEEGKKWKEEFNKQKFEEYQRQAKENRVAPSGLTLKEMIIFEENQKKGTKC